MVEAPDSALAAGRRRRQTEWTAKYPELRDALRDESKIEPEPIDQDEWRLLTLQAVTTWKDGTEDTINVHTLQPLDRIAAAGARPGVDIPLPIDALEMGLPANIRGRVLSIKPCPRID